MTEIHRGQTIEIKDLCIFILRRWRLLLVAALIGAVLFGGYRAAIETLKGPRLVLSEDELEEKQKSLEDMEESISDAQRNIQDKETTLSELQMSVDRYEALVAEAKETQRVSASMAVDLVEISEKVEEKKSEIKNTSQQIDDLENSIEDLNEEIEGIQDEMKETVPLYSGKDIVIGSIFGGLLGMFFVAVYVFCGSYKKILRNGEELRQWYEFPLLCDLYTPEAVDKRHRRGKIDRLLDRFEGIEGCKEPGTAFAVAAAKLSLLAEQGVPVVLAGTVDKEKMDAVCAAMRESLSDQIELLVAGDPMKQPEAALRLAGAAVVLVEEAGTSRIKEIHQMMDFLNVSKTPVIAAVVL